MSGQESGMIAVVLNNNDNTGLAEKLSPNEMAIMTALWDLQEATGKQVLGALDRQLAHTTLLTYLARLEIKGYVSRRPSDRGYLYTPAVPRLSVAGRLLDQTLTQFDGRISSLVSHFVSTGKLTDDERHRLRAVLDSLDGQE